MPEKLSKLRNNKLKILLCGAPLAGNMGAQAMSVTLIDEIKEILGADRVIVTQLAKYPSDEKGQCRIEGWKMIPFTSKVQLIKGVPFSIFYGLLRLFDLPRGWLLNSTFSAYVNNDVLIDISGISFSDNRPLSALLINVLWLIPALATGLPWIKACQAVGPFKNPLVRLASRLFLARTRVLILRGDESAKFVRELLPGKKFYQLPDIAFNLKPAPDREIRKALDNAGMKKGASFCAVGPSWVLEEKMEEKVIRKEMRFLQGRFFYFSSSLFGAGYLKHKKAISGAEKSPYSQMMAKAIDKLIKISDCDTLLIPHSRAVRQSPLDDLEICRKIKKMSSNPDRIKILEGKFSSRILKGIIGKSEVAFGSRFHFVVASISQNIPTLAVSWSHKYKEMMKMLEQERFALGYDKLNEHFLLSGIDRLWRERKKISKEIESKLTEIKKLSKDNARIIADFVNTHKKKPITVNDVVKRGLCVGCGSCVSSCPVDAISMFENKLGELVASIDFRKCNFCGICVDVCPGNEVDFEKLTDDIFDKDCKTSAFGAYRHLFLSRARDKRFLIERSSGGTITDLIRWEMKNKSIDGCVVVLPGNNPFYPKARIVRSEKELLNSATSCYCPVSLCEILKELIKEKNGNYAFVGLPCHIHGLRKMFEYFPSLKKRITLVLGLFCGNTKNFEATRYLLESRGIDLKKVKSLDYRGGSGLGDLLISLEDGSKKSIDRRSGSLFDLLRAEATFGFHNFFTPRRCLLCCDETAELADISFGDAWLPEVIKNHPEGSTIVIVRTRRGEKAFNSMIASNLQELEDINEEAVRRSQKTALRYKNKINAYVKACRILGLHPPKYSSNPYKNVNPERGTLTAILELSYNSVCKRSPFKYFLLPLEAIFLVKRTLLRKLDL
ncbi:Coenzyme F420 hydrogenase/dehydrogenase, beta subunit C-terminal domain [candidate division WOR-3 bacterium]|nr:Coenzyme F420 hydrogenase/dehydrogenase, beta subunit C-terminal domain [candidate division WOR-3 bacterium]